MNDCVLMSWLDELGVCMVLFCVVLLLQALWSACQKIACFMLRSGAWATAANILGAHLTGHPMLVDKAEMIADGLSLLRHKNKNRLVLFCWCNNKLTVQNNNKRQFYQVVTSQYQAVLCVVWTELPDQCQMIRFARWLIVVVIRSHSLPWWWSVIAPKIPFFEKKKKILFRFFIFRFLFYRTVLVSKHWYCLIQMLYQTLFWYCDNTNHHWDDIDGSCEDQLH